MLYCYAILELSDAHILGGIIIMKRLVAYFSASKTTEKVANMIAEEGGYDICEITPKEAYSQISKMKIYPEEFEKTPKKSIKRYLYQEAKG